jgi:hypothetical protein
MSNVYVKLMNIQSELNAPKNLTNKFGGYQYRSAEGILEALKPLLKQQKAALIINDDVVFVEGRHYIKATAKFIDTETGEFVETSAMAREENEKRGMDASQLTGSTSSYARKYALNGLFAIDDNRDADSYNTHGKDVSAPTKAQTQSKQNTPSRSKVLSEDQIKALYEVSEKAGYSAARLVALVKAKYKCDPEYLTKAEYEHVYGSLNKK